MVSVCLTVYFTGGISSLKSEKKNKKIIIAIPISPKSAFQPF